MSNARAPERSVLAEGALMLGMVRAAMPAFAAVLAAWLLAGCASRAPSPTSASPELVPLWQNPAVNATYEAQQTVAAGAAEGTRARPAGSAEAATPGDVAFPAAAGTSVSAGVPAAVERLRVDVVSRRPHDPMAFTEGLVWSDGDTYESTGLYGESSLRRVDPLTGDVIKRVSLAPELFGEGLALVGDRLVQLTWLENVALTYDRASLERLGQLRYDGEGWGLCFDGRELVRSDGSAMLYMHDPNTFAVTDTVSVTMDGSPVVRLNELECVGEHVYANVWQTDEIVRIDRASGAVDAVIDASGLLTAEERRGADVLNGIAYDSAADTFLITGKLWPTLFEVRLVPATPGG